MVPHDSRIRARRRAGPPIFRSLFLFALFLALSLALLLGVGWGEAHRTYPELHLERSEAQGGVLVEALRTFLHSGVPLEQVSGIGPLMAPVMASSPDIEEMHVRDAGGEAVFSIAQPETAGRSGRQAGSASDGSGNGPYSVRLPLRGRFEEVGELSVQISEDRIRADIERSFARLLVAAVLVWGLSIVALWIFSRRGVRKKSLLFGLGFNLALAAMSIALCAELVALYSRGVEAKAEAMASSLGSRLRAPLDLGLELSSFSGLDTTFEEYRVRQPEIEAIALVRAGVSVIHTDSNRIGKPYQARRWSHEERRSLSTNGGDTGSDLELVLRVPITTVLGRLWGASKNFLALLVALALISRILLQLLLLLSERQDTSGLETPEETPEETPQEVTEETAQETTEEPTDEPGETSDGKARSEKIRTFLTLSLLMEGLCLPVMATWLSQTLGRQEIGAFVVSLVFMSFFAGHAAVLIPAGRLCRKWGAFLPSYAGVALSALALFGLALSETWWVLVLLRALAGVGQGLAMIGSQSALFASSTGRTRAASLIVLSYQTGMIAGAALGSLLALYTSPSWVFQAAAGLGVVNLAFARQLLDARKPAESPEPAIEPPADGAALDEPGRAKPSWRQLVRSREVSATALLVGIPTKALASGGIYFGLPLMLVELGFDADAVGHTLMLYAIGVLLSNLGVARVTRRLGSRRAVLTAGMGGTAAMLVLIGVALGLGSGLGDFTRALLSNLGTFGLGIAHGLIHAPAVALVADSPLARRHGIAEVTSNYRFLERMGSVAGPASVGLVAVVGGAGFAALGFATTILAGLYAWLSKSSPTESSTTHDR